MARSKMHKCKTCGQEIAKSAKVCPHCGAKQKGGLLKVILIAFAVLFVIGVAAGGGSNKPEKVEKSNETSSQDTSTQEETTSTQEETKTEEKEEASTNFTIGEVADYNGVQISVQNAMLSQGTQYFHPDDGKVFLGVIVDIANGSDKDIAISSVMNFEAYCDDYALQQDLLAYQCPEWSGFNQVDNKVAAGKRMSGVICYQVPANFVKFDLSIATDFWSNRQVDFTFTHDQCN